MASNAVIETIQFINRSGSPRLFGSWDALGDRNLDKIKPLFAAVASAIGGRNGYTEAQDHSVSADLSMRPVFGGALDFVASQPRRNAKGAAVTCSVSIGPRDGGGFGLAVKLQVTDESLPQAELEAVTREAQEKNLSVLASDAEKRAGGS